MLNIAILLKTQYFFGRHDQSNQYLIIRLCRSLQENEKIALEVFFTMYPTCILFTGLKSWYEIFRANKKKCLKIWIIIICFRLSYLNYFCKTTVRDLCQLRFSIYESIWKAYTYSLNSLTVQLSFLKAFSH